MSNYIEMFVTWMRPVLRTLLLAGVMIVSVLILCWERPVHAQVRVKGASAEDCYGCHTKTKETLSRKAVHAPFRSGQCLTCHNVHASDEGRLLNADTTTLCLQCHDKLKKAMADGRVHGALKQGNCGDCHDPHGTDLRGLLLKPEGDLCSGCHGALKGQMAKALVHAPFKAGKCSTCHNAHVSTQRNLLSTASTSLCKQCHAPQCKASGVSIVAQTKDRNCLDCHGGHAADAKGLLGPFGHASFLAKDCAKCHNAFAAGKPVTTVQSGQALCFTCHKRETIQYADTDPHAAGSKNPCALCHSFHASESRRLTLPETDVCLTCHEKTAKKAALMLKTFKKINCAPVRDMKCFECHIPLHSQQKPYFRQDPVANCNRCHTGKHRNTHPIGANIIDPRFKTPMTCTSCHSMHEARAEYMLSYDRKRQLCIQCHKK